MHALIIVKMLTTEDDGAVLLYYNIITLYCNVVEFIAAKMWFSDKGVVKIAPDC